MEGTRRYQEQGTNRHDTIMSINQAIQNENHI